MEMLLLKSTAIRIVGKAYLSADHSSDATGLDPAIQISKNGGAFANPAAGASVMTEIGSGWYYFSLGAGDVDTLGPLIIQATHATMDPMEIVFQVVETVTAANITQIGGVAQSATDLKDFADTGYDPSTHKVAAPADMALDSTVAKDATVSKHSAADVKTAVEAAGSHLALILEDTGTTIPATLAGDFNATQKLALNSATPAVTVSDKSGFSLSTAGILAIWHQALDAIVTASTIGKKLKDWVLGTDNKNLISADAQDLSATLDVNAKKLGGATPNNAVTAPTAEQVVTALQASTGWTAGGTWTLAKIIKYLTAWSVGKWQDKSGSAGTYQVMDGETNTTPVIEVTPAATTPQKTTTPL